MQPTPDQLATAATIIEQVIDAIPAGAWDSPTPCAEWNVRDLVLHVVDGNRTFVAALQPDEEAPAPQAGRAASADSQLLASYQQSTENLLDAFRRPGALDQTVTVPFGTVPAAVALHLRITDLLVHAWDLAQATGQHVIVPVDLAEQELAFSRRALANIAPEHRPFDAAQPVADGAPAIDRLAALLGRTLDDEKSRILG